MKMTIRIRYRWWAKLYAGVCFLLAVVHIALPFRWTRWVCERSTQYRVGDGPWLPVRVNLAAEAQELARDRR